MKQLRIEYLNGSKKDIDVFQMIEIHRTKDNRKYLVLDGVPFWLGDVRYVYLNQGKYYTVLDDLGSIAHRIRGGTYYMYLSLCN